MSVIATSTGIDNDEELHMSQRLWEQVRNEGLDNLDDSISEDSDSGEEADAEGSESEVDSEMDDKLVAIDRMG